MIRKLTKEEKREIVLDAFYEFPNYNLDSSHKDQSIKDVWNEILCDTAKRRYNVDIGCLNGTEGFTCPEDCACCDPFQRLGDMSFERWISDVDEEDFED